MMPFSNGFLLSLSLCLDIGIANIAMITLAMQRGYFHGFWLGIGTCVGDLIYAVLALAGMAVLLQYQGVRWVLWIGGSMMLLWFAYKMLRAAFARATELAVAEPETPRSVPRNFLRGVVLAMSSPTAIPVVCGGGRCADFTYGSGGAGGNVVVPFRLFYCRRGVDGSALFRWQPGRQNAGGTPAEIFLLCFGGDFWLLRAVRGGVGLP
ncbi:leucine export protein LeuE [Serratia plymuthica]|uniref:Leucine export protein LeuE n=1 Tax=Serratia plymuthica TaxID=82996 RepID=A0A2X4V381_SERPL|nr:leucine export protein LeuE [Serratia plymuthica]